MAHSFFIQPTGFSVSGTSSSGSATGFRVKVKICGLQSLKMLDVALDAGADYIGLVHFPQSPRHVSLREAASLSAHMRNHDREARSVLLLVAPDDTLLDEALRIVDPDIIQLHGNETPKRVACVAKRANRPVLKAVKIGTIADVEAAHLFDLPGVQLLFDAKPPALARPRDRARDDAPPKSPAILPGGNGTAFDWNLLQGRENLDYMLSGGLTPENVGEALKISKASAVDVSSGVEIAPGRKDSALIRQFLKNAHA